MKNNDEVLQFSGVHFDHNGSKKKEEEEVKKTAKVKMSGHRKSQMMLCIHVVQSCYHNLSLSRKRQWVSPCECVLERRSMISRKESRTDTRCPLDDKVRRC